MKRSAPLVSIECFLCQNLGNYTRQLKSSFCSGERVQYKGTSMHSTLMNAHFSLLPSESIHQRGVHAPSVAFHTIALTCFNSERYSWTTCMFHPALHLCWWKMLKEPGVLTHKGIQSSFRRWNGSFSRKSKEENPLDEMVPFNLPALMPAGHKNRQAHPRTGFGPEMLKIAITVPNLRCQSLFELTETFY